MDSDCPRRFERELAYGQTMSILSMYPRNLNAISTKRAKEGRHSSPGRLGREVGTPPRPRARDGDGGLSKSARGQTPTNLQNKGRASADRGNRATLPRTAPRFLFKSSARDSSRGVRKLRSLTARAIRRRVASPARWTAFRPAWILT